MREMRRRVFTVSDWQDRSFFWKSMKATGKREITSALIWQRISEAGVKW